MSSVLKHKRSAAATAALAADVKPEGSLLWSLGFSPLVRAAEGTVGETPCGEFALLRYRMPCVHEDKQKTKNMFPVESDNEITFILL